MHIDGERGRGYDLGVIVTEEIGTKQLSDLIKQVQAGNEVWLTQDDKLVAKIVSVSEREMPSSNALNIRSIKGHLVLTPNISQAELAEEMFVRQ